MKRDGQAQSRAKSFILNNTGDRRLLPTLADSSGSWVNTEILGTVGVSAWERKETARCRYFNS